MRRPISKRRVHWPRSPGRPPDEPSRGEPLNHSIGHQIPPGTKRLFIECTATAALDVNTGVQRVVRNIVNRAGDVGPEFGFSSQGVVFRPGSGFQPIDGLEYPDIPQSPWDETRQLRGKIRARIKHWLEGRIFSTPLKNRAYRAKYLGAASPAAAIGKGARLGEGDVLLLAGCLVGTEFSLARSSRAAGCRARRWGSSSTT